MARASIMAGAVLAALVAVAGGAGAAEYSFRGIPLGITLDEFRRLPHPDQIAGAQVFCTGEVDRVTNVWLEVFGADATLGVKRCSYYTVTKLQYLKPSYFLQKVQLGAIVAPADFVFYPDPERGGTYRLMLIVMEGDSNRFDAMVSAYTERFGKPASLTAAAPVETPSGRRRSNMVAVWTGGSSEIRVTKRFGGSIKTMEIQYFEKRLFALYAKARGELTGKPSDKL